MKTMKTTLTLLTLTLSLSLVACGGEDPATQERGVVSDPGPVKADGTNSCKASCGVQAASGCWCDQLCTDFGDCCPDYRPVCAELLTCANVKCASGTHCEMKGINGGSVPVCIKDPLITCANMKCGSGYTCDDTIVDGKVVGCVPLQSCANVKCASGTHCQMMKGPNAVPVPACIKDLTCADLGGSCLPLTFPMGSCASDEIADTTEGLCQPMPGSTSTCCRKDPDCASLACPVDYHCELKGINGGSVPVCIKN